MSVPAANTQKSERQGARRISAIIGNIDAGAVSERALPVRSPLKSERINEIARSSAEKARSALRASKDFAAELLQQEQGVELAERSSTELSSTFRASADFGFTDAVLEPKPRDEEQSQPQAQLRGSPLSQPKVRSSPQVAHSAAKAKQALQKAKNSAASSTTSTDSEDDGGERKVRPLLPGPDGNHLAESNVLQGTSLPPSAGRNLGTVAGSAALPVAVAAASVASSGAVSSPATDLPSAASGLPGGDIVYFNRRTVTIPKGSLGLGITLVGGTLDNHTGETAICVKEIKQGSAAEKDGRVFVKDRIFSVNGQSVEGKTYKDVVEMIKTAQSEVTMELASWKRRGSDQAGDSRHGSSSVALSNTPSSDSLLRSPGATSSPEKSSAFSSPEKDSPETKSKLFAFAKVGGKKKQKDDDIHNIWARKAELEDAGLIGTDSENSSGVEDENGSRRGSDAEHGPADGVWPRPMASKQVDPNRRISAQALIEKARREKEEQEAREKEEVERRRQQEESWLEEREAQYDAKSRRAGRENQAVQERAQREKVKKDEEERAKRDAEEKKREERKEKEKRARMEAEQRKKEEEEEEERLRREAEERRRREVEEERMRREAEDRARREAEEKLRREAEAVEKRRRQEEERMRREAEDRLRREEEAKANRDAQELRDRRMAEERERAAKRFPQEAEEKQGGEHTARRLSLKPVPKPKYDSSSSSDDDEYVTPVV